MTNDELLNISVNLIDCNKKTSPKDLGEILESIKERGIIKPLRLRYFIDVKRYEIIAGKKRFQAAKILNFKEIPAIITKVSF